MTIDFIYTKVVTIYTDFLKKSLLYIPVLLSIFTIPNFAQDVEKLKKEQENLLRQINETKKELISKEKTRDNTFKQINLINNEINIREKLISTIQQEINQFERQININNQEIKALEDKIKKIKEEYVRMLQDTYLRRNSMNDLLIFLSAKDFTESYNRYRLLKEYSEYRKQQGIKLIENQEKLKVLLIEIQSQRKEKEESLIKIEKEKSALNQNQKQKTTLVAELQKEERWLKQTLSDQEKRAKALENQILAIIRQAQNVKTEYGKNFKDNMGKLPWPVTKGVIISEFGEQEHPVIKGVTIKNNGIDIKSSENDDVFSVFEGEISRVINIPGYNNAIIIRHADYLTVYANLKDIYVKQGQKVTMKQKIATLYKEKNEKTGTLHFEIWKESQKLNPKRWLIP
ncbi:MAG: peptidoglycan DD-metalloendopeptidase family protein [Marinilabiliaceae bacterium]|nr:peptidoglycan DD-metalloendopeptidase family protein [Marinilabiliaceae bacterium]